MMNGDGFTPTQRKIMDLLRDGHSHPREHLCRCFPDELANPNNIRVHITLLRKKVRRQGLNIVCEPVDGVSCYRLMRIMSSASNGRR